MSRRLHEARAAARDCSHTQSAPKRTDGGFGPGESRPRRRDHQRAQPTTSELCCPGLPGARVGGQNKGGAWLIGPSGRDESGTGPKKSGKVATELPAPTPGGEGQLRYLRPTTDCGPWPQQGGAHGCDAAQRHPADRVGEEASASMEQAQDTTKSSVDSRPLQESIRTRPRTLRRVRPAGSCRRDVRACCSRSRTRGGYGSRAQRAQTR